MRFHRLLAHLLLFAIALTWGMPRAYAQDGETKTRAVQAQRARKITQAEREAAADRQAAQRATLAVQPQKASMAMPMPPMPGHGMMPDYFGSPNWAYSPPLRKFVDTLPGLGPNNANNLGQFIPVAVADTITYPGSDYYEIEVRQYTQKMHSDLPATTLRGYVQVNKGTDANGQNTLAPDPIHYLGPVIVAQKDRPVRIKFTNKLPTGSAGDLFIPVDTTVMGAGMGPLGMDAMPMNYTQNRAVLHLHGGRTPWISDGTPHQWITPAGEMTPYKKGVSVTNVPDMPEPGEGSQTYYYTNQQSSRLMFYHDHSYGITRLNVYVGEAAGYLINDPVEKELVDAGLIPSEQLPLIIQDKSFVDATTVRATDPLWNWGTGTPDANGVRPPITGDLWYPHVYSPAQNPYDMAGVNPYGRWHYGPWFWPPTNDITHPPVANPYYDPVNAPWEPPYAPAVPHPSMPGESFFDTAVVNGTAFPTVTVQPKSYRMRILNAANDRFWNLQLYLADGSVQAADGRKDTEVKMVPAAPNTGLPETWPADGREGGVPDPTTMGPNWIQIGTEGGFLPMPVIVPNQPIAWNGDPTTFNMGNVSDHSLLLGPAERADVIVDFSAYAGKTLILYNDAPAAFPALDPRYDYYTGAPDLRDTGGHEGPKAGFGPNTRTIMQIKVAAATPSPAFDFAKLENAFKSTATAPGVFERGQDPIIVGQSAYNTALNKTFPTTWPNWGVSRIQDTSMSFQTVAGDLLTVPMEPKAIQDEMGEAFDMEYGRMSGKLGVELVNTSPTNKNFVLYNFFDPATELVVDNMTPMSPVMGDGTQLWKITHNGVDTHPIHFHLFDVQLINRVGWDGAIRLPDANELGWKETVRVSPLEDTIVALRPISPKQPFGIPESIRLLDPTMPEGSTMGFTNIDPKTGDPLPTPITNQFVNFLWEYVWHCHLLSHEEMDMMRPMSFKVETSLPSAPGALAITSAGVLTWTDPTPKNAASTLGNPANEIGFLIDRASYDGIYTNIGRALANATTFTDTNRQAGVLYAYRVYAYNATGISAPSNTVTLAGVPAAPTNVTAVRGNGQATVSFTAPATNGGSPIIRYTVTANPGGRTATGTGSPIIVTGLTNGTAYTFTVTATNAIGTSAPSAPSNSVTPATVPGAPTIGTAVAGNAQATVSFTAPASTGGSPITAYTVTANPGGRTATGTGSPIIVTGLTNGTAYTFTVRATNAAGTGPASAASNSVTPFAAVPAAPTGRSITRSALSTAAPSITLTWYDNSTNETGFTLQRATNTTFTAGLRTVTLAANATTFTDTNLAPNTRYYYRINAFNAAGSSAWSATASSVTVGRLPIAPSALRLVQATRISIALSWVDNATNEQGFYIERSIAGINGPWTRVGTVTANTVRFTNSGLTANTAYWYRVRAYNADGPSSYSNILATRTLR